MTMISSERGPRRRSLRRAVLGAGAVITGALAFASASWACAFWNNPAAVVTPNRAPAASNVTVTGTGWQPELAVTLALSTDGNTVVQPLGTARVDGNGTFTARIPLGQTTAGVYYVSATQDTMHTNVALEVLENGGALVGQARGWQSLEGNQGASLNDLHRAHQTRRAGFPWLAVGIVGSLLVMGGALLATELRRDRALR